MGKQITRIERNDVFGGLGPQSERLSAEGLPTWLLKPDTSYDFSVRHRDRQFAGLKFMESMATPCSAYRNDELRALEGQEYICLTNAITGRSRIDTSGTSSDIKNGDLYVWSSYHEFEMHLQTPTIVRTVWIPAGLIRPMTQPETGIGFNKLQSKNPMTRMLYNQLVDFHECVESLSRVQFFHLTNAIIETMLGSLESNATGRFTNGISHSDELFGRVVSLIRERIDDAELSAEDICERMNISSRSLRRICTEQGTTFSMTLREVRLRHIARLLRSPSRNGVSLTEVAHHFGFYDLAHFSRAFRNRFGSSPTIYARNWNTNPSSICEDSLLIADH